MKPKFEKKDLKIIKKYHFIYKTAALILIITFVDGNHDGSNTIDKSTLELLSNPGHKHIALNIPLSLHSSVPRVPFAAVNVRSERS